MSELQLHKDGTGTLAERIYARVVEAILRGDFAPGGRLPTEGALAARFGVSRPTVREALSRLRSDGVIETRRGSGSQVLAPRATSAVAAPPIASLADIERYYAFRCCVEAGAAAAAAEARDAADLEALRAGLEALNAALEAGEPAIEEDVRLHFAIARASHNPFFITTIETTVAPVRQFMELARSVGDRKSPERVRENQAEHQAIVEAIARRSPADAAEAVRVHVLNARRRIFESTRLP